MRPRKRILLCCADEDQLGVLAYTLETNRYATVRAATLAEARLLIVERQFELLFCVLPFAGVDALLDFHHSIGSYASTMVRSTSTMTRGDGVGQTWIADATVGPGCGSNELLDRIKVLTARKRGPRPHRKLPIGVLIDEMQRARRA